MLCKEIQLVDEKIEKKILKNSSYDFINSKVKSLFRINLSPLYHSSAKVTTTIYVQMWQMQLYESNGFLISLR